MSGTWFDTHIFVAELVSRKMDSAVGTSSDLFMDCVLIDSVMRASVIILVSILRLRIKSFLWRWLAEHEQGPGLTL